MNQDSTPIPSETKVVFPLTLKDAIEYLASQTPEYIPNNNNLHNKIWQQLSQRLRLIFDEFPENQFSYKTEDVFNYNYNDIEIVEKCSSHQLSTTRKNSFKKKLRYIYCAVTMYYIQSKGSPLSSSDVPEKWLQQKTLKNFIFTILLMKLIKCSKSLMYNVYRKTQDLK